MKTRSPISAILGAALLLSSCGGDNGGAASTSPSAVEATTPSAVATPSSTESASPPQGFYIGTVSRADAENIAPPDVVAEFFPEGTETRDFGLRLEAGSWWESDVENGREIEVGDLGAYTVDGNSITFTSENVPQVLTFAWTFEDGVLTLEAESSNGNGPIDGFYPDELIVMAHGWTLQA